MAETEVKTSLTVPERSERGQRKVSKRSLASTSSSPQANASWLVGDVVWSKIPGHPWWPSMVAYDPNSAVYFQYKGRARYYHVQFFGQDPVRGWASERSVMKFEGKDHFCASVHSKNHRVAPKRVTLWETAVKVAEKALPMNRQERQLCFTFKYYDKHKERGQGYKVRALNGISPEVEPSATLKPVEISEKLSNSVNGGISEGLNDTSVKTEDCEAVVRHLKSREPRKRKRKGPQYGNDLPSSTESSVKNTNLQIMPVKIPSKRRKRVRNPKIKEGGDFDNVDTKLPTAEVDQFPSPPCLNGEYPGSPMNGELSPNSALKLKIRKVRPLLDSPLAKKRRGRPPKEKETFIIVNDLEKQESETDLSTGIISGEEGSTEVVKQESKPDVTSTSVCSTDEEPKKRKRRRKLEDNFNVPNKETSEVKKEKEGNKDTNKVRGRKTKSKETTMALVKGKKSKETKNNEVTSTADVVERKKPEVEEQPNTNESQKIEGSVASSNDDETGSMKVGTIGKKDKAEKEREAVCVVCEQVNDLLFCEGLCNNAYHPDCIGLSAAPKGKFICDECTSGVHSCFICRQTGEVKQCNQPLCSKFYHVSCLQQYKCTKIDGERSFCPLHFCSTCTTNKTPVSRGRMIRCVRCPTAYHLAGCLVAGCMPITSHLMVCAKHFWPNKNKAHHSHVNVNWCFVCSIGGTLICCESCPAAFHPECISYDSIPEGHFDCKDCTEGKALLYGDVVWVKLGMYRWWPAQICNPRDVPTNIQSMRHQPGEFPVMFLGSHDYYWIHKGRVFSYQDGDKGTESGTNKYLAKVFKKALVEAKEKYSEWKKARENKAEQDLQKMCKKPAPYKNVKVNKCTTAQRIIFDPSEMPICECSQVHGTCGPESNCLNRMLQFECNPNKCPAKEECQNQRFLKREHVECESFRATSRGWGLRTKQVIKKGSFVIEYVGELIDEATCLERVKKGDDDTNYYMLTIDKDCIIDAGPMGNLSRFMNHSCNPNCETQKWTVNGDVRVGLFASRDVEPLEELTFDYRLDCQGNEKKKCHCGSKNCSGFLGVRPKTQNAQLMEDKVKKAATKRKKRKPKKPVTKEVSNMEEAGLRNEEKNIQIEIGDTTWITLKVMMKTVHEDECFMCGDGGQLIMCDRSGCLKCYHVDCLNLAKKPYGRWLCPWHFCDECGKRATVLCSECPNSFCKPHTEGNITCISDDTFLCNDHDDIFTGNRNKNTFVASDQELVALVLGDGLLDGGLPGITPAELDHLPQKPEDLELIN